MAVTAARRRANARTAIAASRRARSRSVDWRMTRAATSAAAIARTTAPIFYVWVVHGPPVGSAMSVVDVFYVHARPNPSRAPHRRGYDPPGSGWPQRRRWTGRHRARASHEPARRTVAFHAADVR